MSSRFYQLQSEATGSTSRTSSPHRPPAQVYRTSTSSDSSSSSSYSYSSSYSTSPPSTTQQQGQQRYSMDQSHPRVEIMRCSRCAKCVETIVTSRRGSELRRVSTEDASASGMVRFGHNLYYCERCARLVGYK